MPGCLVFYLSCLIKCFLLWLKILPDIFSSGFNLRGSDSAGSLRFVSLPVVFWYQHCLKCGFQHLPLDELFSCSVLPLGVTKVISNLCWNIWHWWINLEVSSVCLKCHGAGNALLCPCIAFLREHFLIDWVLCKSRQRDDEFKFGHLMWKLSSLLIKATQLKPPNVLHHVVPSTHLHFQREEQLSFSPPHVCLTFWAWICWNWAHP